MNFLDNCLTTEILDEENNNKRIVVILLNVKSPNQITITYLNKEGEIRTKDIMCPNYLDSNFEDGNFLIYDGENFYRINNNYLKSLNEAHKTIPLSFKNLKDIKMAAYILTEETNKYTSLKR